MELGDFEYVFGPVMSRRLGRSLGIDVVPFKTCTYDCVYCQLGRTTCHTLEREDFVPVEEVVDELKRKLDSGTAADYITIGGSGEPTLYARLGELIRAIKKQTAIPVAVLTNGSLLWDKAVQDELLAADVVVPSLDAATRESYKTVNRPCSGISFEQMVDGLVSFRKRYPRRYWLEILLLQNIAASEDESDRFAELIARIRPDRVQLHTVARPSPGGEAQPVARADLERFAMRLGSNVEVVMPSVSVSGELPPREVGESDVLDLIRRHPATLPGIAAGLGADPKTIGRHIESLLAKHALQEDCRNGETFYCRVL